MLTNALIITAREALIHQEEVDRQNLPRMADAAVWIRAAEYTYTEPGTFDKALNTNAATAIGVEIESSMVAMAILEFMRKRLDPHTGESSWSGYTNKLHEQLTLMLGDRAKAKGWAKEVFVFGKEVRRHLPSLRQVGVEIILDRDKTGTIVTLSYKENNGGGGVGNVSSVGKSATSSNSTGENFGDNKNKDSADLLTLPTFPTSYDHANLNGHIEEAPQLDKIRAFAARMAEEARIAEERRQAHLDADDYDLSLSPADVEKYMNRE